MAIRTYIPRILTVAKFLANYLAKNGTTLKGYMGDGLYAALVLVIDLVVIVAEIIEAGHTAGDPWVDFTAVNTLTASDINQIQGAIDKFYETIGVTP